MERSFGSHKSPKTREKNGKERSAQPCSTIILDYMQKIIVRLIKKVMLRGGQFGIGPGTLFSPKVMYCIVQKWKKILNFVRGHTKDLAN